MFIRCASLVVLIQIVMQFLSQQISRKSLARFTAGTTLMHTRTVFQMLNDQQVLNVSSCNMDYLE